jgi:hypothetical protein
VLILCQSAIKTSTFDNTKQTCAYTAKLADWGRFVAAISKLCVSVKSQRSVKHIWFLPTRKPNAKKPKELALSHRT